MTRPARSRFLVLAGLVLLAGAAIALVAYPFRNPTPPGPQPPNGRPTPPIRFTEVTGPAGITFRHVSGASGRKLLPETMGAGVAVLDYDGDGKPDLFFVNSRPWPGQPGRAYQALYRNKGDGTFEDVTDVAGLAVELYGQGVTAGDYDNDGRPDLFVAAIGGNRLFRNADGKRFEDLTAAAGLDAGVRWPAGGFEEFTKIDKPIPWPSSVAFLDYDCDGKLDLFVCHYLTWSPEFDLGVPATLAGGQRGYVPPQQFAGAQCELWRNVDGKRFENVSTAAGVQVTKAGRPAGKALGVVVCDPDEDGWPDLVVANDTEWNFFFHNIPAPGGGRTFKEEGNASGLATADGRPRGGMGIDAAEIMPDMYTVLIANFTNEASYLFRRTGVKPLRFADVAPEVGLAGASQYPMKFGAFFLDVDRDGRLDLFSCNGHLEPDIATVRPGQTYAQPAQLFWNTGDAKVLFDAVFAGDDAMFPPIVGRGCAYLDYDGDGDLDLVVTENNGPARLFRNDTPSENRSVRLLLNGNGTTTNRDGIGAEVTIEVGGQVRKWYANPVKGYMSQSERAVTIGVGTAAKVDRVWVRWPGSAGQTQEWHDLAAGQTFTLMQAPR